MKPIKIDRRLTGSSFIDEPLQQVCVFELRNVTSVHLCQSSTTATVCIHISDFTVGTINYNYTQYTWNGNG